MILSSIPYENICSMCLKKPLMEKFLFSIQNLFSLKLRKKVYFWPFLQGKDCQGIDPHVYICASR